MATSTVPLHGPSSPRIACTSKVLPDPTGPTTPTRSVGPTMRSTLVRKGLAFALQPTDICLMAMIGDGPAGSLPSDAAMTARVIGLKSGRSRYFSSLRGIGW